MAMSNRYVSAAKTYRIIRALDIQPSAVEVEPIKAKSIEHDFKAVEGILDRNGHQLYICRRCRYGSVTTLTCDEALSALRAEVARITDSDGKLKPEFKFGLY